MPHVLDSIPKVLELLSDYTLKARYGLWIFRGLSKYDYKLIPKVGRSVPAGTTVLEYETNLFNLFKRGAFDQSEIMPSDNYEWLALAQHHGLPTRLLDWSFNPLVALYFAVSGQPTEDGAIVALRADAKMAPEVLKRDNPFELTKQYKFLPNAITRRIHNQQGLFTISNKPNLSLEANCRKDWILEKWRVNKKAKDAIKYELFRYGIDDARMFPDLDGLSRHLDWRLRVSPPRQ